MTFTWPVEKQSFYRPGKTKPVQTIEAAWTDDAALVLERKADGWRICGFYAIEDLPRGK